MAQMNGFTERLNHPKSIMDAIYKRHSVRDYSTQPVSEASIHTLLYAAIQAPTSIHQQPWVFGIVQNKTMLSHLSDDAKELTLDKYPNPTTKTAYAMASMASKTDFNIFYNAATLIVIYAAPETFVEADCWLAAQNLMLAAYGANLGSCVIGFAVGALNTNHWKEELDIPHNMTAYAPIIVGYLAGEEPSTNRKPPKVLCWHKE